jgi:FkbM family methyltransferase
VRALTSEAQPPKSSVFSSAFDPRASLEDIYACFRLLLGRNPSPEHWAGHSALAGGPLDKIVASYLNSLEFRRRGLLAPSTDFELVQLDRFMLYTSRSDLLIGEPIRRNRTYEPHVTAVFLERIQAGDVVLDIGANIGYFSMLAASLGAEVYAAEPLAQNVRLLAASRIANGYARMQIVPAAASSKVGCLAIAASHSNGIVSTHTDGVDLALASDFVAAIPIDRILTDQPVALIKIDVGGHEYLALQGAAATIRRTRPLIVSEFSPQGLQANSGVSGEEYLQLLRGWNYRIGLVAGAPDLSDAEIMSAVSGTDHVDFIATPA